MDSHQPSLAQVVIESIPTPPEIFPLLPVQVVHPAIQRVILFFPTFAPLGGAHFGTMTEAASIVTNNKPGYFVRISDNRRITGHRDSWVEPGDYYYFLDSNPDDRSFCYPLCLEFRAWEPVLPPVEWSQAHPDSEKQLDRASHPHQTMEVDQYCCISGRRWALQSSHLVPASENPWYIHHKISGMINEDLSTCHRASNLLTMTSDYNVEGLDAVVFTFALVKNEIVTYTISNNGSFSAHHHLKKVDLPPRIKVMHVWCRFAWSVIHMARDATKDELVPLSFPIPIPDVLRKTRKRKAGGEMAGRGGY